MAVYTQLLCALALSLALLNTPTDGATLAELSIKSAPETRMRRQEAEPDFSTVPPEVEEDTESDLELPEDLPEHFFPFGVDLGDSVLGRNDDSYSSEIPISTPFRFFNNTYSILYVNTNGLLSFNGGVGTYTPSPFPIASQPVVAVFWADVNTNVAGTIYYREITERDQLADITEAILEVYAPRGLYYFRATWAYMATYYQVSAYGSSPSAPRNSFQVVIATDGTHSFTIFNYGEINWTYGSASGTIDAQVGFDAGDNINFFSIPTSRTPAIANVNEESNIGFPGRWMFRIDLAEIDSAQGCSVDGPCAAHEQEVEGQCVAVAPALSHCPELVGPTVVTSGPNQYAYFYCELRNQNLTSDEIYEMYWLFNGERDISVPGYSLHSDTSGTVADLSTSLHEKHLAGHMGQWVSCEVVTHFEGSSDYSIPVKTEAYWVGIRHVRSQCTRMVRNQWLTPFNPSCPTHASQPSEYEITVYENEEEPAVVYLESTIPIPCQPSLFPQGVECYQRFLMESSAELLVYQPGRPDADTSDSAFQCSYYFYSQDWNSTTGLTYNVEMPLLVRTLRTAYNEPDLVDRITFNADILGSGVVYDEDGRPYQSIWAGYQPQPIVVYRLDVYDRAAATCAATGDPRMSTLDGRYYSVYATGQFVMLKSSASRQFEVQIRTYECAQTLSCTCGVVVREGNESLSLDMCTNLNVVHRIVRFADGADWVQQGSITVDASGRSYTISMPSGAFVNVHTFYWGMNVLVNVLGQDYNQTSGLCGTFNNNPQDDYLMQGGGLDESSSLDAFVNSWRIPLGESYFERNPELVVLHVAPAAEFCPCLDDVSQQVPCGVLVDTDSFSYLTFNDAPVQPFVVPVEILTRRRRQASGTIMTYEVDPSYEPNNYSYGEGTNNVREFSWPTPSGITESQARERCSEAIEASSCVNQTSSDITVEKCILDVKETDSFDWVQDKLGEAQFLCLQQVIRQPVSLEPNMTVAQIRERIAANTRQRVTVARSNICPNNCFENGDCVSSVCLCRVGFTGVDCSLDATSVPDVYSFASGPLCDISQSTCSHVRVITDNLFDSENLSCQIRTSDGERENTAALFQGINEVICTLPDHEAHMQRLESSVVDYTLRITRDGLEYGSSAPYRVYDSLCQMCPDENTECIILDGKCSIRGRCYMSGELTDDGCFFCDPDSSQTQWSVNPNSTDSCINGAPPLTHVPIFTLVTLNLASMSFLML